MIKFLLKTLWEKIRNNMNDYYFAINLQGLGSNIYALILSLEKPLWGKHEIRHMLVLYIVSLKTLNEKT